MGKSSFSLRAVNSVNHKRVALFLGPTSTETGAGVTKTMSKNIQLSHIWCRPCSQNGSRPCYRNERYCMNEIQPDAVINQIKEMI